MSTDRRPCPICHVIWPGQCRNTEGDKIWIGTHAAPAIRDQP